MSVHSVRKEKPNFTNHMSYCTVFCEVQFLFTYRRNTHVLLHCVLWSSVPLYPQKKRSCVIDKTQYNKTSAFLLLVKRNRTSQNTVQYDMSVHSVGKEKRNFTNHSKIRHEPSFCGVLWSSVPLYLQKERSCLIVLCFVKFGSSLLTEETLMCYCTVFCEIRFLFTGKEEPNITKHSTIRHERSFCG
jgi:hypothetical protein